MKPSQMNQMILTLVIFTMVFIPESTQAESDVNTCLDCHIENDLLPADYFEEDIHEQAGLSCAGCHGGDATVEDMDESMSVENGYIGIPEKEDIPQFCGKCHSKIEFMRVYQPRIQTDQEQQYYTSLHGQKLKGGNHQVAQCSSCHSAHKILPANDTRSSVHPYNIPGTCDQCHGNADLMSSTGHNTKPYEDYARSVHGIAVLEKGDTGAPACNDCHGNHGAAPPGAESVAHICGSCHLSNMEFFKSSKMGESFNSPEYHSCEQCHGNHAILPPDDEYLNVNNASMCLECHDPGDEGYIAAVSMYEDLSRSDSLYGIAQTELHNIRVKGMNDVDIVYTLREAKQNMIQSRTMVHTFDALEVKAITAEGLALSQEAIDLAAMEIGKFNKRRLGFGLSTLAFVLLAFALYLKIRQIDEPKSDNPQ